jgi:hypothetical protein
VVPGCSGTGSSGYDYCILPAVGQLVVMGDANLPAGAFPLSRCEGDCDTDADCEVRFSPPSFPAMLQNCAALQSHIETFCCFAIFDINTDRPKVLSAKRRRGSSRMHGDWSESIRLLLPSLALQVIVLDYSTPSTFFTLINGCSTFLKITTHPQSFFHLVKLVYAH